MAVAAPSMLTSDRILQIARIDAERAYRDLAPYRITIALEADGWHVDYDLKDDRANGGGPHYVIDPQGAILAKPSWSDGRIVELMATGRLPNRIAARIFRSLDDYAQARGQGEAYTDNMGFAVPELTSGRESFNPATSYYDGPFPPDDWTFVDGPPNFAVEVRSESDYGSAAEAELAAKRADYFEAGTLVVWDADPHAREIRCWNRGHAAPRCFVLGQVADAEPAVPGWRISVDAIFAPLP